MRYTILYNNGKYDSWRPFEEGDEGSENSVVSVTGHANPGTLTLEVSQYYGAEGCLRLTITQPVERALSTFGALLAADHYQEQTDNLLLTKPKQTQQIDDEIDLSNAELFCDSHHGIYVPQYFAQNIKRDMVEGVSAEDYAVLEKGPDHEHYWDAWADVLDNASVSDPVKGKCHLHQDGDLWIVPEPVTKFVLGHEFRPMDRQDWYGFAGAEAGSYICYVPVNEKFNTSTILILSPAGEVSEINYVGEEPDIGDDNHRDWKADNTDKIAWEHKTETKGG